MAGAAGLGGLAGSLGGRDAYLVANVARAPAVINNSILKQTDPSLTPLFVGGGANPASSGANNLIRSSVNFSGSSNTADPMLGPLANNGGFTQTIALLTGSPAIEAGSDAA